MIRFLLFALLIFQIQQSSAQCPNSAFTIQTPVCAGESITISNQSSGASSYSWDFCPGFFNNPATQVNDTVLPVSFAGDITLMHENNIPIVFLCGKANGNILRVIYGAGPEQQPTLVEDLGNLSGTLFNPSDIAFVQDAGNWYGFVVDYGSNSLIRVEFGNSLLNAPSNPVSLLNNSNSNFSNPWAIRIARDTTGKYHGIVVNFLAGTFTLLDFGGSIQNTPVPSSQVIVQNTTYVLDVALVQSCGKWLALFAGYTSGNIILADFGPSLNTNPTFQTVLTSNTPSDIALVNDSSHWKLLFTNYSSHEIQRYDLGADLAAPVPVHLGTDYLGGTNPKGISLFRQDGHQYTFVLYTGSNLIKVMDYSHACRASVSTSTDFEPATVSFSSGGTYAVALSASDNFGRTHTTVQTINVEIAPVTRFGVSGQCLGASTQFTDSSTIASGNITSWYWDFGNGDTSSFANPNYTYPDTGTYVVQLTTTGNSGCSASYSRIVSIHPTPLANFNSTSGCSNSAVLFNDLSTISFGTISNWNWQFGTGDSSQMQDPSYLFPGGGNFLVSLTVTSDQGCSASNSQNVPVLDSPVSLFAAENTCSGQQVQFNNLSSINGATITAYSWDFGDGNTSNLTNPDHQYAGGTGTYTVQLIVDASNSCSDTLTRNITISEIPTAAFSFTPATVCEGNDVLFTDLSSVVGDTIVDWFWDFGDGNTSTLKNPIHQFLTTGNNTVSLIAYSPTHCPSAVIQQVVNVVASPAANFSATIACLGAWSQFTDLSTSPTGTSIVNYSWKFGTGDSSNLQNPDYLYSSPGLYDVSLTVTSDLGCINEILIPVRVHALPVAAFSYSKPCTGQLVNFSNNSSSDSLSTLTNYFWNFGDFSNPNNTSTQASPGHTYSIPGVYTVFHVVTTNHGCTDTTSGTLVVRAAPVVNFTYSPTCFGDLMQFFNPGSAIDSAYIWNFGDNQINLLKDPAHYYAFPGNYTVSLTVYAFGGCATTATKVVNVSPIPQANFVTSPACIGTPYQFTDASTVGSGSIIQWNWTVNSTTVLDSVRNPVYLFPDTGSYSVNLKIQTDIGCTSQVTKTIKVYELPQSRFTFNPQFGNPPLDVQFSDLSINGATYAWNFGDGSSNSSLQHPFHTYQDTGLFVIQQVVTSSFGCKDSSTKNIYVIQPILDIAVVGDSSYIQGNHFYVVARLANLGTRTIDNFRIEAQLENGTTIQEQASIPLPNGPSGVQWYPFNAAFQIQQGQTIKYYCIRVLSPNNSSDDKITNNEKCFNKTSQLAIVQPYPNPFTTEVNLKVVSPFEDDLTVDLLDFNGKLIREIYSGLAVKGLWQTRLNLSDLNDGVYFIRTGYSGEFSTLPVLKNSRIE